MTREPIFIHCETCRHSLFCVAESSLHRHALLAWAHGLPAVECDAHMPRLFRGIEGVIAKPVRLNPPRPLGSERQNRIDHGQR